ncbi:hypothetical protein AABB24_002682 [Solanum stoloniferum]|uniref:Secreted protein n=1 Tax=Solanum stoloniferum TaxID=62892 RepID=A0ABD2V625_9SOLN
MFIWNLCFASNFSSLLMYSLAAICTDVRREKAIICVPAKRKKRLNRKDKNSINQLVLALLQLTLLRYLLKKIMFCYSFTKAICGFVFCHFDLESSGGCEVEKNLTYTSR